MISIIVILSLMVVILGYTTFNLLKKNERQEDILAGYMAYLNKISGIIEFSSKKLKEIDHKGHFEADDEVGFFFQEIKQIQEILDEFNVKKL
jgi:hypothetical protein